MKWTPGLEVMGSVRIADNDRDRALEVAAGYVENGVSAEQRITFLVGF